jgi:hypothetical protein
MLNLYIKAHQKMMQRPIVSYLSLKGMSPRDIRDDIVAILGSDASMMQINFLQQWKVF